MNLLARCLPARPLLAVLHARLAPLLPAVLLAKHHYVSVLLSLLPKQSYHHSVESSVPALVSAEVEHRNVYKTFLFLRYHKLRISCILCPAILFYSTSKMCPP